MSHSRCHRRSHVSIITHIPLLPQIRLLVKICCNLVAVRCQSGAKWFCFQSRKLDCQSSPDCEVPAFDVFTGTRLSLNWCYHLSSSAQLASWCCWELLVRYESSPSVFIWLWLLSSHGVCWVVCWRFLFIRVWLRARFREFSGKALFFHGVLVTGFIWSSVFTGECFPGCFRFLCFQFSFQMLAHVHFIDNLTSVAASAASRAAICRLARSFEGIISACFPCSNVMAYLNDSLFS